MFLEIHKLNCFSELLTYFMYTPYKHTSCLHAHMHLHIYTHTHTVTYTFIVCMTLADMY